MLIAWHDCETNGLLLPQGTNSVATKMHSLFVEFSDGRMLSCADQPGYDGRVVDLILPSGTILNGVVQTSIEEGIKALYEADMRVAHNGDGFDNRIYRKFYPHLHPKPGSVSRDTMLLSRLLYPMIYRDGPNSWKCPPKLRMTHKLAAWGLRLGEAKDTEFDHGDWQTWTPDMQLYMIQDVRTLKRTFMWLMSRKPDPRAVEIEHEFAAIIRRQEAWGMAFDRDGALTLQADLQRTIQKLESELIDYYGSWWKPGKVTAPKASRKVKLKDHPDVTLPRWNAKGQRMAKDYVGPPLCEYMAGCPYTPVSYVEFNPASRDHVRLMLYQRHGWVPREFTDNGAPKVDDDVLRGLPWPEAEKLADYYGAQKILGYVSQGKASWLDACVEEGGEWRIHGAVNTIGTYSFRCSHFAPNMGQIPTRDPNFGHRCRQLFKATPGFDLGGGDGSSLQLRLLGHYLTPFDGGAFAKVVAERDAHEYMRDLAGTDIMGEGAPGRAKGKTMNYTLVFGGGDGAVGRVVIPHASDGEKRELGRKIKLRAADVFGPLEELKAALKKRVEAQGQLIGLDGRVALVKKAYVALATLLQMAEAVVMKRYLILLDGRLQEAGMVPGVDDAGACHRATADYEFCVNVHDEAQADLRPQWADTYRDACEWALPEAGRLLGVQCPLKAEVKMGSTWHDTH